MELIILNVMVSCASYLGGHSFKSWTRYFSVFVDPCQCWDDGKGVVYVHGGEGVKDVKGEQRYSCCES